ncbi:MAG: YXWGXW repeat-containing protein [Burkholderiales bacterium]|nr:YXWGXW repeat-containing protein [Burkholderiales bacterium]
MRNRNAAFRPARLALVAGVFGAALLTGCVVAPVPGAVYNDPYGYPTQTTVYAPVAPPTPYYEVQPALPYPGAIWISGYWNWSGNRHQWVPGRYERPRHGYRWQPHRWDRSPRGGWQLQGGGWMR